MFWDRVLAEVLNKNNKLRKSPWKFTLTNINEEAKDLPKKRKRNKKPKPRILKTYFLGKKLKNIYLTKREAECMLLLLKGKSVNTIAKLLKLSPRTIEYYFKNIKAKLDCRTKFQLVEMIQHSEFINNIDFEI